MIAGVSFTMAEPIYIDGHACFWTELLMPQFPNPTVSRTCAHLENTCIHAVVLANTNSGAASIEQQV